MMLHLLPSILARRKIPAPSSRKFISKQKVFCFGKGQFCVFPETEPLNAFQEDEQRDSAAGGVLTFMVTSCVDPRTDELSSIRSEKPHSVSRDLPGEKGEICKKKTNGQKSLKIFGNNSLLTSPIPLCFLLQIRYNVFLFHPDSNLTCFAL